MAKRKIVPENVLIYLFVGFFALCCVIPMALAFIVSISAESSIVRYGYSFLPKAFSLRAYKLIFGSGSQVLRSYGLSVAATGAGTFLAVLITCFAGYSLSIRNKYMNCFSMFFFITMVFSAGIVPWYLISTKLGLRNNFWALIIPSLLFNPFNMFLTKNFMQGIPVSLRESAVIDGANDIHIALKLYMPLCAPIIATIALFYGLGYWNDYWNAIMLVEDKNLYPLQYMLLRLKSQIQMLRDLQNVMGSAASGQTPPSESIKMATALVTIGPIVLFYPYLQKYFVSGLTIGSVKG
ncbi:MAG: carbohydrate ABC transporter permease [Spirochaetaceae bacterium]|jgi:putative aldouronate transport system permease protein|nr:carbohydrate ABC transporter permease [Spirochaetaceae bacterium]